MSILTDSSSKVNTPHVDIVRDGVNFERERVRAARERIERPHEPVKNLRKQREYARARVASLDTIAITSQQAAEVATLEFTPGGIIAKKTQYSSPGRVVPRGEVKGLSKKSAKRLRERMCRIDWRKLVPAEGKSERAFLVSITYPKEYPTSWREHKAHRKALLTRITRRFGVEGMLWRLEHQKRTAPHYHIILVLADDTDVRQLKRWLLRAWYAVVGSGDWRHAIRGVDVEALYGKPGALMRYLSKVMRYISKSEDGGAAAGTGRCWGVWGELPEGETLVVHLTRERWVEFTRRLRKWGRGSRYCEGINASWRGFCVFGADDRTKQLLRGLWQYSEPGVDYAR